MSEALQKYLLKTLCPNSVWELSDLMKITLKNQILHLPKREVTEDKTRYPINLADMRAFMTKFFARHYLQAQNSLINYMSSEDFIDIIKKGNLKILDIGSGPAVVSLAITDIVINIVKYLHGVGEWQRSKKVELDYILNDTSSICLGIGQRLIEDYFRRKRNEVIINRHTFRINRAFPENMSQLRRISMNLGLYDIVIFSYVLSPLIEDKKFKQLINGILDIESFCNNKGRILILQDRFQKKIIQRVSGAINVPSHKEKSDQSIFPKRNENETYRYTYYSCLYSPRKKNYSYSIVA
jgi:ribosomal protein RSM22 (predicted rRNA methylase)